MGVFLKERNVIFYEVVHMSRYDKNEEHSAASVHENKYFSELRRIEGSLIVTIAWKGCNKGVE